MNILITGASGFIGQNLIKSLLNSEHKITACIHKTELPFNIKIFKCYFSKMLKITDWLEYLVGIDVVINCVGIIAESRKHSFEVMHVQAPIALFKACEKTHVKRIIQVSALGADGSALTNYHKTKKQADDYLRSSSLEWIVLRPSLVYGQDGKSFKLFKRLSNLPIIPLIGNGNQLIQPVKIDKMVEVIEQSIVTESINQTIDVVGEQAISYKQWMQQLRGRNAKARFFHIPIGLMRFVAKILKPLNFQLLSTDNLIMLEQNNVGDFDSLNKFMDKPKHTYKRHPRECGDPESFLKLDSRFHGNDKSWRKS